MQTAVDNISNPLSLLQLIGQNYVNWPNGGTFTQAAKLNYNVNLMHLIMMKLDTLSYLVCCELSKPAQ